MKKTNSNKVRNWVFAALFAIAFTFGIVGTGSVANTATVSSGASYADNANLFEVAGPPPPPNCAFCYDW